jgi:hypothetical protein
VVVEEDFADRAVGIFADRAGVTQAGDFDVEGERGAAILDVSAVSWLTSAEQVNLIPPAIPIRSPLAREQVDIGTVAVTLDAGVEFIGLSTVLASRLDDKLMHILAQPAGRAASS